MLAIKKSGLRWFKIGLGIGFIYFLYIFFWLWNLYPLGSFGITTKAVGGMLIFIFFFLAGISMAVWWGIFGYISNEFLAAKPRSGFVPAILAGTFVLAEYMRSFFFGIISWGGGSIIGAHWTIGNPAYLFVDIAPILKTVPVWGIYGIDFILIYFFGGLIFFTVKKDLKNVFALTWIPLTVAFIPFVSPEISAPRDGGSIPVAIIQTRIPSKFSYTPDENISNLQAKLQHLEEASLFIDSHSSEEEGLVIFPEGSNLLTSLTYFLDNGSLKKYFNDLSKNELLIFDQNRQMEKDRLRSRVILISSKNGLVGDYQKKLLTPGGEFLPYLIKFPMALFSPQFRELGFTDFHPGFHSNIVEYGGKKIKIVVCSELLSPNLVADDNGDFIIALHNFGLFNGGRLLERQILAMSRFRAVENGKYSVTSSNYGQSYIINPSGTIEKKAFGIGEELLTGEIIPNQDRTWYNYVGDWPILSLSLFIFGLGIRKIRNGTKD